MVMKWKRRGVEREEEVDEGAEGGRGEGGGVSGNKPTRVNRS